MKLLRRLSKGGSLPEERKDDANPSVNHYSRKTLLQALGKRSPEEDDDASDNASVCSVNSDKSSSSRISVKKSIKTATKNIRQKVLGKSSEKGNSEKVKSEKDGSGPPSSSVLGNKSDHKRSVSRRKSGSSVSSANSHKSGASNRSALKNPKSPAVVEWKLTVYDEDETEPQTMEQEFKRLQNLQQYFLLDSKAEEEFDTITRLASMAFATPIALVSLVDLGRQWFMSKVGLDAAETPRSLAFCAHVVLNKYNILVVPDATKDFRFKNNALVTHGLKIRFYAGAALISPEGFKLGTLCVIDNKPRRFSENEAKMLHEMAKQVVHVMVARRIRLLKEQSERTMKDLGSSLTYAAISLEEARKLLEDKSATTETITETLKIQAHVCKATARLLLEQDNDGNDVTSNPENLAANLDNLLDPKTCLKTLVSNLASVIQTFPRKVPVILEVESDAPSTVVAEDLLLFRSALNLISNSLQRTQNHDDDDEDGEIHFYVHADDDDLVFETQDCGPEVSELAAKKGFSSADSLLGPVSSMVASMGGSCGMRIGSLYTFAEESCIFWFRVPLEIYGSYGEDNDSVTFRDKMIFTIPPDIHTRSIPSSTSERARGSLTATGDVFQAAVMQQSHGCVGEMFQNAQIQI